MFAAKPGVMEPRLLTADDVVFTYELLSASPKKIPTYFDHIDSVDGPRRTHGRVPLQPSTTPSGTTVSATATTRASCPRETADIDRKSWRNVVGTGPFMLTGTSTAIPSLTTRNSDYWDTWRPSTAKNLRTSLRRSGRLSHHQGRGHVSDRTADRQAGHPGSYPLDCSGSPERIYPGAAVESLARHRGQLPGAARRPEPLGDVRVRRALNLAVNQQEIVEHFYGGHAELMAYPQHPGFGEYFQPLEEMPESVQELFGYDPAKARALLAEAGYPDGFEFKVQVCSCSPGDMDLIPLLEDYLARVGVRLIIQPMEYASFLRDDHAHTPPPT
jgi:peptide/nickel transport system substrate-binding protein